MTPRQWRLSRQVTAILSADAGRTDSDLAERLGVTLTELRPVIGMLIGWKRVEPGPATGATPACTGAHAGAPT